MPTTVDQVIKRFESQLGVTELPFGSNLCEYNNWYWGSKVAGAWCATFVSWCFYHEGLPLPATIERGFAYTPSGAAWFQKQGRWTTTPRRGHVVFFDFPNDGVNRISHVGIVVSLNPNGSINTIEGNTDESGSRTGGKVMRRVRSVGIVGYGIPAYSMMSPTPSPIQVPQMEEEDMAYVIWSPSGEGSLLLSNGKVVMSSGTTLDKFKAAGAKEIKFDDAEDYNAIPTIGNAF